MNLKPDDQVSTEAQYAEEASGPEIFRAETGDQLHRASQAGCWCFLWRGCAVLGALGMLSSAGVGLWLLVQYLWPAASQPTSGTSQDEMTLRCSEASSEDALFPSLPKTGGSHPRSQDSSSPRSPAEPQDSSKITPSGCDSRTNMKGHLFAATLLSLPPLAWR